MNPLHCFSLYLAMNWIDNKLWLRLRRASLFDCNILSMRENNFNCIGPTSLDHLVGFGFDLLSFFCILIDSRRIL